MTVEIRALQDEDDRAAFRSGDEALDTYFHRYAGQNQFKHHIGVSYVAIEGDAILGFVTVSTAALDVDDLPSGRPMPPYPLPVIRLARLATASNARGRGVGTALLRYVVEIAERHRDEVGCVGVLVDAKAGSVSFYERYGFVALDAVEGGAPLDPPPTAMFIPLGSIPRRPLA